MNIIKYINIDCVALANTRLNLLVTKSVGPRFISLRLHGGQNLFAELPHLVSVRPDGEMYHFHGGHRLWHAPENMPRTYVLDDNPVDIVQTKNSLSTCQTVEAETGIEKTIHFSLVDEKPVVEIQHTLTNRGLRMVECAPWAITQLKTGGVAILPQVLEKTGLLPNRSLTLWPYSDVVNPNVTWGNRYILLQAAMKETAFKIGFPNPRGWLAYWLAGTLFVKRAVFDPGKEYFDFNSSSECYCNENFIELETLGPVTRLEPGESVTHSETWELYSNVVRPSDEATVQTLVEKLRLE
jgi:hypothetical protein